MHTRIGARQAARCLHASQLSVQYSVLNELAVRPVGLDRQCLWRKGRTEGVMITTKIGANAYHTCGDLRYQKKKGEAQ